MGTKVDSIDGYPGEKSLGGARKAKERPLSGGSKGSSSKGKKKSKKSKSGY